MADNFNAQIDRFIADTKDKMLAVVKQSIKEVVNDSQTQVLEGGKMRVDTGFLRNSGRAALNQIPTGPTEGRKRQPGEEGILPEYATDGENTTVTSALNKMKIGDTFYFGWTAKYAEVRETYDGFLDSAVVKWPEIVDKQIRSIKK